MNTFQWFSVRSVLLCLSLWFVAFILLCIVPHQMSFNGILTLAMSLMISMRSAPEECAAKNDHSECMENI